MVAAPFGPPAQLPTVTVGAGTDALPIIPLGGHVVVTATKLTAATSLKLGDETYFATGRRTDGSQSSLHPRLQFVAKNGVLRVAPVGVTETDETGKPQTKKSFSGHTVIGSNTRSGPSHFGSRSPIPRERHEPRRIRGVERGQPGQLLAWRSCQSGNSSVSMVCWAARL